MHAELVAIYSLKKRHCLLLKSVVFPKILQDSSSMSIEHIILHFLYVHGKTFPLIDFIMVDVCYMMSDFMKDFFDTKSGGRKNKGKIGV